MVFSACKRRGFIYFFFLIELCHFISSAILFSETSKMALGDFVFTVLLRVYTHMQLFLNVGSWDKEGSSDLVNLVKLHH